MYEALQRRLSDLSYAELEEMEQGVKIASQRSEGYLLPVIEPRMTKLAWCENGMKKAEAEDLVNRVIADKRGRSMAQESAVAALIRRDAAAGLRR